MKSALLSFALLLTAILVTGVVDARAESATAQLYLTTIDGVGQSAGQATFTDTAQGLQITTELINLPPGIHGFHIHENGACSPMEKGGQMTPAQAAGGHYDPDKTGRHLGPDGGGHKGDLPRLAVAPDGTAFHTMLLKNLTAGEIINRAVIVHAGGDNYSDQPEELGGGGARLACGVIR